MKFSYCPECNSGNIFFDDIRRRYRCSDCRSAWTEDYRTGLEGSVGPGPCPTGEPGPIGPEGPVSSPLAHQVGGSHYKDFLIQPIQYIEANQLPFAEGNVIKYISRHGRKGSAEDVLKAIHYCELILQLRYPQEYQKQLDKKQTKLPPS